MASSTSGGPLSRFRRRTRRPSASHGGSSRGEGSPPPTPRTPALGPIATLRAANTRRAERAARRKRREHRKRRERGEKKLGAASRAARRKARAAREKAGGVTHYTLFTPVALPDANGDPSKVLSSLNVQAVVSRLHAFRRWRRQADGADGDLGEDAERVTPPQTQVTRSSAMRQERAHPPHLRLRESRHATFAPERPRRHESRFAELAEDEPEEGDLALPSPALSFGVATAPGATSGDSALTTDPGLRSPEAATGRSGTRRRRETDEAETGWHMSDVPLTPHYPTTDAFARGFEARGWEDLEDDESFEALPESALPLDEPAADARLEELRGSSVEGSSATRVATEQKSPPEHDSPPAGSSANRDAAWWLDINCPTYLDMTELSKVCLQRAQSCTICC
jgi:hypothetical protein